MRKSRFVCFAIMIILLITTVSTNAVRNQILFFDDPGSVYQSMRPHVQEMLNMQYEGLGFKIESVNAATLKTQDWWDTTALLVMPGGPTSKMEKCLEDVGKTNIQKFVQEQKGNILGICGGAFLLSNTTRYQGVQGGKILNRFNLCPVFSIGPVLERTGVTQLRPVKQPHEEVMPRESSYYDRGGDIGAEEAIAGLQFLYSYDVAVSPLLHAIASYKPPDQPNHGTVVLSHVHIEHHTTTAAVRQSVFNSFNIKALK